MAKGEDALDVLRSIDATLKAMLALAQQRTARVQASQPKAIASARDLDGKYGDPEIKFNPRDWTGPSCKGRRFSECPPEFLDLIAETFDYFAQQADANHEMTDRGKPVADYKRSDAARARGWAKRMRDGTHRAPNPEPINGTDAGWNGTPEGWS